MMDHAQVSALLAKAALVDSRKVDDLVIQTWWEILGHLSFGDAMNGLLMHRRESAEYVQPAHIIAQAKKAKRARMREEARAQKPKAISARTPPPPNFRQMIEGASAGPLQERDLIDGGKTEEQRQAARAELARLAEGLGKVPSA